MPLPKMLFGCLNQTYPHQMKPKILCLLAIFTCVVQLRIRANDIEPGKENYTATKMPAPITIDGNMSDWAGVPVLADPKFSVPKGSGTTGGGNYVLFEPYGGGTWSGPDDQTSAVQVAWDVDNVYLGFVVTDDYHENVSGNAWNGDSVQIMIANGARNAQVALYNFALLGYEDDQGNFVDQGGVTVQLEAGAPGQPSPGTPEAMIKRDHANHKTIYEIKFPVDSLGMTGPLA